MADRNWGSLETLIREQQRLTAELLAEEERAAAEAEQKARDFDMEIKKLIGAVAHPARVQEQRRIPEEEEVGGRGGTFSQERRSRKTAAGAAQSSTPSGAIRPSPDENRSASDALDAETYRARAQHVGHRPPPPPPVPSPSHPSRASVEGKAWGGSRSEAQQRGIDEDVSAAQGASPPQSPPQLVASQGPIPRAAPPPPLRVVRTFSSAEEFVAAIVGPSVTDSDAGWAGSSSFTADAVPCFEDRLDLNRLSMDEEEQRVAVELEEARQWVIAECVAQIRSAELVTLAQHLRALGHQIVQVHVREWHLFLAESRQLHRDAGDACALIRRKEASRAAATDRRRAGSGHRQDERLRHHGGGAALRVCDRREGSMKLGATPQHGFPSYLPPHSSQGATVASAARGGRSDARVQKVVLAATAAAGGRQQQHHDEPAANERRADVREVTLDRAPLAPVQMRGGKSLNDGVLHAEAAKGNGARRAATGARDVGGVVAAGGAMEQPWDLTQRGDAAEEAVIDLSPVASRRSEPSTGPGGQEDVPAAGAARGDDDDAGKEDDDDEGRCGGGESPPHVFTAPARIRIVGGSSIVESGQGPPNNEKERREGKTKGAPQSASLETPTTTQFNPPSSRSPSTRPSPTAAFAAGITTTTAKSVGSHNLTAARVDAEARVAAAPFRRSASGSVASAAGSGGGGGGSSASIAASLQELRAALRQREQGMRRRERERQLREGTGVGV